MAEIRVNAAGARRARNRHPWVFRDQLSSGEATSGSIVRVVEEGRRPLGYAAYSAASRIALRFVRFGPEEEAPTSDSLRADFMAAIERRHPLRELTDAVRLISSEADGFPGLIIDRYGESIVIQSLTPFAELLLPEVTEWLVEALAPTRILTRNDASVRRLEGLPSETRWLVGDAPEENIVREGSIRYDVDLREGQKTGLFLDQRRNRMEFARRLSPGARVLDAFAYTGGFALHAARAASSGEVLALDDSVRAVERATRNAELNQLPNLSCERGNAFQVLRAMVKEKRQFDAVILDPPAFAKSRREIEGALRGYREINVRGFRLVAPGGLLLSASCSYHVDEPQFEEVLRAAAADAGRRAIVVDRGRQDINHPILLSLPESRYLKSFVLAVD